MAVPRVCVMDRGRDGPAYPALQRCRLELVAAFPRAVMLRKTDLMFDVVLVGCDRALLTVPSFREVVSRLAALRPVVAVIPALSSEDAVEAARVGFHGVVDRDIAPEALERVVAAVISGELGYSRADLSAFARAAFTANAGSAEAVNFTTRERQAITLVAQGATDDQIARTLGISRSTAHKHVQSAMRRAKVRSRGQLIAASGWAHPMSRAARVTDR